MSPNAFLQAQSREPWVISAFLLMTHCSLRAGPRELQAWGSRSTPPDSKYRASQEAQPRSTALKVAAFAYPTKNSLAYLPPPPMKNPRFLLDQGVPGSLADPS